MGIAGAWVITPTLHTDDRGTFLEWFREERFLISVGRPFHATQANCSISHRGVVRGVHYTAVPPGQAKYVTCVQGSVRDVVVDLREGSATFGRWEALTLDARDRRAVFLEAGLGHGFSVTSEQATVVYMVDRGYDPAHERAIHPLDRDLGIDWGLPHPPVLSERDSCAPSLAGARTDGHLPLWDACLRRASGGAGTF